MKVYYINQNKCVDIGKEVMNYTTKHSNMVYGLVFGASTGVIGNTVSLVGDFVLDMVIATPIHGIAHLLNGTQLTCNCCNLQPQMVQQIQYYFPQLMR